MVVFIVVFFLPSFHLHGERPSPDGRDRTPAKVARVLALLERGAHQNEPKVRPLRKKSPQHDQQELAVAIPLVDLSAQRGGIIRCRDSGSI